MDTSQPPTFAQLMKQHAATTASTSTLRPRPQHRQMQQQAENTPILLEGTGGSAGQGGRAHGDVGNSALGVS